VALFDFECPCGNIFEAFQNTAKTGSRPEPCPKCGQPAPVKWTNGATFKFTFREGYDACTGRYHPTKKDYENAKRELGLVKVD